MMVPEEILLLLFVILTSSFTGSSELQIKVPVKTETNEEGSSVTIPCAYFKKEKDLKLLWFKDPNFAKDSQMFDGTIVYSNTDERPQSPDYSNRVKYITNVTSTTKENVWIQCNLLITDLQKTDSGNYSFRFIGSKDKYISKAMNLTVTDNPCKVHIEPSELKYPLKESEEFTAKCSTFSSCLKYPEWLVHTSGQKEQWVSSSLTDVIIENEEKEGRNITKIKFNVTWKDDKRSLSCRPAQAQDIFQIRNITLSVEYAPRETTAKVSSEYVKEGDSVTLSCESRGRPDVTFSWFKKDNIEQSQQMSDFKLNNVKPEDSGEYYCGAKNKHGAMTSTIIIIDVKYGPKGVTVKPLFSVEDLKEGDALILKCSINDSNPLVKKFEWYNNYKMSQQTSDTLTISNVTADDGGSYYCQADNGIKKEKSNEISVSVKYSARNVTIQGSHSVKMNSRLTLTCSGDANPKPVKYTWKHTPGLSSFPFPFQTGELNIDNVTIKHAGQYTCIVTNAIGSSSSNTFNVDVLYPPSKLSLIMKSELREFEVFLIICTVQSFPMSKLTVTGPQDIINIQNNQGNITESVNSLTIYLNITESHAGRYKCKADNSEGKLETEQELTVLYAPKNVTASSKGEQTFGSELILTCEARSKPAPSSFEWMKSFNGQLKTVGHVQKLHFHSLNISDSGQFVCIAYNSIGKARSQLVDIRVKYTPNITIVHNMTAEGNRQLAVYLTCSADAYPPATDYKWYREDNLTVLSDQQNFTVLPQNPGVYYCTAANIIGKSRSNPIPLFFSSYFLKVLCQIILPIILLILIGAAIFLMRRTIIKGSQNNTRENLSIEEIPDPFHGRVDQSHPTPNSQDPTRAQDLNPRLKSNIHTVYSAIKLPQIQQGKCNPKPQKPGCMDNELATSTLNYVTLDFKRQNEPKRAPKGSAVYAMVSKNKQSKNTQSEHHDYENVSSACASRLPFTNIDWESDTSEEDEVNYSTVSCSAKPDVKEPKHKQRSHLSSSSSDYEDRTEYSAIKTETVGVSK
ncbi:B-cell receptor CD22-like isoform X2 [Siphateles boraxobius]|uniref:B-cell receptor CD22-like isoform X2 n=1 Tax=Siphateles boraxobius TaxID=180520 RepID=UPI004063638D